jgi:hypothetical protein
MVVAGADLVEQRRVDLDPERLTFGLAHFDLEFQPAPVDVEHDIGLVHQEPVLDDVAGHLPADGHDLVAGLDPGPRRRRRGRDSDDSWKGHATRIPGEGPESRTREPPVARVA